MSDVEESAVCLGLHNPLMEAGGSQHDSINDASGSTDSDGESSFGVEESIQATLQELGVSGGGGTNDLGSAHAVPFLFELQDALERCEGHLAGVFDVESTPVTNVERQFIERTLRREEGFPVLRALFGQGSLYAPAVAPVSEPAVALASLRQEFITPLRSSGDSRRGNGRQYREDLPRGAYAGEGRSRVRSFDEFVQGLDESSYESGPRGRVFSGYPSRTSRWK